MKIFLICPVRNCHPFEVLAIEVYVHDLESRHQVYWPARDTEQDDSSGGYEICRANFQAMLDADQIHIWYDEKSNGSKFDMGGVFMLVEMLGYKKRVFIVNRQEAIALDSEGKSFLKVMQYLAD